VEHGMSDFGTQFRRLIDDETAKLSEQFGVDAHYDYTPITVDRPASYLPMSIEMLLDSGAITEEEARARGWTPTPPVKVSRWRRARWRWQSRRERAGRKIGGWLAGVDLTEREDD
jgi:hypothetical protein